MRYQVDSDFKRKLQQDLKDEEGEKNSEEKTMSNFDLDANDNVEVVQHNDRAIKYKDL